MMELIDSHCHIDLPAFDEDRETVLKHCREGGVRHIVVPGVYRDRWEQELAVSQSVSGLPRLHPALGLHPCYLAHHRHEHLDELEQRLAQGGVVAVGEIGLDFFIQETDAAAQKEWLEAQLQLAKRFDLPVLLHVRKAHDELLKRLRQLKLTRAGFVHAFSGSEQQAYQYLDLGFRLGFGGAVTYDRATKLRRILKQLPDDGFVLETDAPDIPPAFQQGPRNTPEHIPRILSIVSDIRGQAEEDVARQTTYNAKAILPIA